MVRRLSSEGKSGLSSHEDACWTSEQNTCNNGESVCAGDQREATGRSPCSTQEDVFQLPAEVSEASEGAPVEPRDPILSGPQAAQASGNCSADTASSTPASLPSYRLEFQAPFVVSEESAWSPPFIPEISFSEVLELVSADAVEEVHYSSGSRLLLLLKDRRQFASTLVPGADASFFRAVAARVPRFRFVRAASVSEAVSFVFPVVLLCLWWRMLRSLIDSSRGSKDTGTDRGLEVSPPLTAFSDVVSRQKHELLEVVSLLNGECRYAAMGARLPRGVLLVGPSGTGKTLLARAVAGEARVPFLSAAASEFVEVFVGQGARRVREVFQAARRRAPCVLFIDELDALGNRLSPWGTLSGHEEYVQTVNQFLMEMDGVCGGSLGVVVIGATNRLEAIDPALLRSGRFDRHIHLQLPSAQERHEILKLHARSKKLRLVREAWAHLQLVGDAAEGLSGADLENLLNESIFRAVRRGREAVDPQALDEALLALLQRAERQNIPCS
ncbi:uncharacterized protein LOC34623807 [Cyclospora cayetanensis]|uniref:Uncharacterized protein LOC34623807 n=1 Tax=Cyclospora cayetanensis TaxID=88456 RepID=A0A6P6RQT4_9EIME|nr:uncharacterized protein LOC34623807 [Cyclospora cayetanensis]